MRVNPSDGRIQLEARECRVLTEAAAIAQHIARVYGPDKVVNIILNTGNLLLAADTLVALGKAHQKPTPEPPEPPENGEVQPTT